jgi:F0F1-type ATP synthase membrane subunit b/b'
VQARTPGEVSVIAPPNASLLLIMACFWLVYLVVRMQLVKPLGELLDERSRRIREAAELLSETREQAAAGLDDCHRRLAEAAAEAQRERLATRAAADAARRGSLEAARERGQQRLAELARELDVARDEARTTLRERSRELAVALAERLLERRVTA